MNSKSFSICSGEAPDVEEFLAERIYEHNSKATGYFDGESFSATQKSDLGEIDAGVFGFTWGGCCFVSYLWVSEKQRHHGLGSALLQAVEQHARAKGCTIILLSTHTFQAPGFYERNGYKREAVIRDYPVGHADLFYAKRIGGEDRGTAGESPIDGAS